MFEFPLESHSCRSTAAAASELLATGQLADRLAHIQAASERLALIAGLPPSPVTLAVVHGIDVRSLDAGGAVTWLAAWERHRGWFDAFGQAGIVAVGGPAPAPDEPRGHERDDWGREKVALALRLATSTAGSRLDVARELTGRLTRTRLALSRGEISYWHAKAVVDAAASHDDEGARRIEAVALDGRHPDETLTNFRKRVVRIVIAAEPKTADERHLAAVAQRRVISWPEPDGMATVQATLTADEAAVAMCALTSMAARAHVDGDDRPVDVRRADAFAGLFAAALADPQLPTQHGARPWVGVTMDFATVAGLADHPGHLDGYGPIPPVLARRLAAGGDWHRLVTDPVTGALLDYGTKVYRPPAELAEFILARDRTCRFPTCNRAARLSDIDHAEPYDDGGVTAARNCGALCRRNHREKTQGDTRLVSHPDGSATWTTSSGHTYHRPAIDHCPEHTAHLNKLRTHAEVDADSHPVEALPEPPEADRRAGTDRDLPLERTASTNAAIRRTLSDDEPADTAKDTDRDITGGNDPPPL